MQASTAVLPDPARPRQARRGRGEVLADLRARRPLVEARVLAGLVDAVLAERQRDHPVVGRRAVQADERIRMQPVAPGRGPAVDQRHLDVGLRHQGISEGEAAGAGPDDQVIGLDRHLSPLLRGWKARGFYSGSRIAAGAFDRARQAAHAGSIGAARLMR